MSSAVAANMPQALLCPPATAKSPTASTAYSIQSILDKKSENASRARYNLLINSKGIIFQLTKII